MPKVRRQTVDLTGHPDLVVVYLGMQVKTLRGLRTVAWLGPKIQHAVQLQPDGLLSLAPAKEARGAMFSARRRLRVAGEELAPPALSEQELYG